MEVLPLGIKVGNDLQMVDAWYNYLLILILENISLLYTFCTYAVGIRGLCIHICISHWYDLWNLYEDIPFFLLRHLRPWSEIHWETSQSCDRQSIMEYKHATQKKQSALKNHVNILAGNSARMTTSEKKTSNNPKAKRSKMNQKVNRTNANKLFLRHANKCHRQRSIAWPRYLSWLGFTMGALSGLRRKLFGGAQAGLGGFGIVWAFGAKVRFGSSF